MGSAWHAGTATLDDAVATFEAEGCSAPRSWANESGDRYGRHDHPFHKVLFCLSGSIVFHTDAGDIELEAGGRLDIKPGTSHSATVGPEGCDCVEASR